MSSNGDWGHAAEHSDELAAAWDSYAPLPESGNSDPLDAFCERKNLTVQALVRQGAKLSGPTVLAYMYRGGCKYRDVESGKRWATPDAEFTALKIVKGAPGEKVEPATVLVSESETDAARLGILYPGCDVAIMPAGAKRWMPAFAKQLDGYECVLVALDNDEAGNQGAEKIKQSVPHAIRFAPPEDCNDWGEFVGTPPALPAAGDTARRGKFAGRLASGVTLRQVAWLWQPWVPRGALTLLFGEEGIGKGTTAAHIAAQATRGAFGAPMKVEWVTFEDDPDSVVVPRLAAAGANLDLVRCHDEGNGNYSSPLVLPDDLPALGVAMVDWASKLLVIDPLPDALREGLKDNNNADVRSALRPLQQMAKQLDVAIVGVAHPNKGATTAANKVMGSKAFRTVPRSVILFASDPDDVQGPTRIMCLSKSNGSSTKPSVKLRIASVDVPGAGPQPRIVIEGDSDYSDADLVTFTATGKLARAGVPVSQADRARTLIFELLTAGGGEIKAADAYAAGALEDISERTMKRERAALKIVSQGHVWRVPEGWSAPKEPVI